METKENKPAGNAPGSDPAPDDPTTLADDRRQENQPEENTPLDRLWKIIGNFVHAIVLILSLLLIVYISYDTFENIPFLENHRYMTFQFWVCVVFMADFVIELLIAPDKRRYLKSRWFFALISIPYLNIINVMVNIDFSPTVLYFIRFVPLIRGGYSLSMVTGYVSHNRAVSLLSQYLVILLTFIYICSLIFYYEEHSVNPDVLSYWDALYWACMNVTTVGCYFPAVTLMGKIISVLLPTAGMMMLPLFTVFIINSVKSFDAQDIFFSLTSRKPQDEPDASRPSPEDQS